MNSSLRVVGLCIVMLSGLAFAAGSGRSSEAAKAFARGKVLFDKGQYVEAATAFEKAHRLSPHASALNNAGLAWEKAQEPARAADAYELALELDLAPALATKARSRLSVLKKTLGYVVVAEPSGGWVSVGHVSQAAIPVRIHLPAGRYDLVIQPLEGEQARHTLEVAAAETRYVTFTPPVRPDAPKVDAPRADATPPASTLRPKSRAPNPAAAAAPSEEAKGSLSTREIIGWSGVGVGAVSAGVAAVFGVRAIRARDEFLNSGRTDVDARERSASARTTANVTAGVAVVTAATGIVLLVTGKDDAPAKPSSVSSASGAGKRTAMTWRLDAGPRAVALSGAF